MHFRYVLGHATALVPMKCCYGNGRSLKNMMCPAWQPKSMVGFFVFLSSCLLSRMLKDVEQMSVFVSVIRNPSAQSRLSLKLSCLL